MSQSQPGAMVYTQGFGSRAENVEVPVIQKRAPASTDANYPVGKPWVDSANDATYSLTSLSVSGGVKSGNWQLLGSASGSVASVLGTANQITVSTASNVATVSLPSAITAPGSLTTTTSVTATLGAITASNGNLVLGTAGNKLSIATGSNASVGTSAAMTAGTITISTTAVSASSIIFLICATPGGTQGILSVGTITAGTSFVINSSEAADTSTVNWLIIN